MPNDSFQFYVAGAGLAVVIGITLLEARHERIEDLMPNDELAEIYWETEKTGVPEAWITDRTELAREENFEIRKAITVDVPGDGIDQLSCAVTMRGKLLSAVHGRRTDGKFFAKENDGSMLSYMASEICRRAL